MVNFHAEMWPLSLLTSRTRRVVSESLFGTSNSLLRNTFLLATSITPSLSKSWIRVKMDGDVARWGLESFRGGGVGVFHGHFRPSDTTSWAQPWGQLACHPSNRPCLRPSLAAGGVVGWGLGLLRPIRASLRVMIVWSAVVVLSGTVSLKGPLTLS